MNVNRLEKTRKNCFRSFSSLFWLGFVVVVVVVVMCVDAIGALNVKTTIRKFAKAISFQSMITP